MIDIRSEQGIDLYRRSLCMLLYAAVEAEAKGMTLRVEHSISHGQYCRLYDSGRNPLKLNAALVGRIQERMRKLAEASLPIERHVTDRVRAIEMFEREGLWQKVELLRTLNRENQVYYTLGNIADSYVGRLAANTSELKVFDLRLYKDGMLLLGPDPEHPTTPCRPVRQVKMFKAFEQSLEFNKVTRVSCVGELNKAVETGDTSDLINVAEAMHSKLLSRISDDIMRRRRKGGAKIVLLAGPSSSGKTTTCKRLAIQLMTSMMQPKMISLDDYFVNRADTPRDAKGDYDYESLYALDLKRFNSDLSALLAGEEINLPTYSFELGERVERPRPLRLDKDDVLLIEGIHGLNPELTKGLPSESLYKVYVSALTSLRLDNHNWISTSDNRLLRRMVRDHRYRHTEASSTLARWQSVRDGEEKWIFPFQENADAVFNSSLIFELGVMKEYVEPLLLAIPEDDPNYYTARRLLDFLSYFVNIPADQVPTTSLLREFLGGSSFHY